MYSMLSTFNTTTEVPLLRLCVHFGWVHCRAQIPSRGHNTLPKCHVTFTKKGSVLTLLFTFTFMYLADAVIQSDLHCIQVTVSALNQLLLSLGIKPMILALLTPYSTS